MLADHVSQARERDLLDGESVSVAIEEVSAGDWAEKVYKRDIVETSAKLYKKPGYTM